MREKHNQERLSEVIVDASERRVSIWSVSIDFGPWFYLLLVAHTAPLVYLLYWTELTSAPRDNIADIIVRVTSGAAPLIFVAAVVTIIELEVVMVLREWYRAKHAKDRVKEREKFETQLQEAEKRADEAYERGIERGRQIERNERNARRNGHNRNGSQED